MNTGTVKFFKADKGWGFITPDDDGKDIFVHGTDVDGNIIEGDSVTFDIEEGAKGPKATNVSLN